MSFSIRKPSSGKAGIIRRKDIDQEDEQDEYQQQQQQQQETQLNDTKDPPTIIFSKKKKQGGIHVGVAGSRKWRDEGDVSSNSIKIGGKKRSESSKGRIGLSFGDDEEEDGMEEHTFKSKPKPKATSLSIPLPVSLSSKKQSTTSSYTTEELQKLKSEQQALHTLRQQSERTYFSEQDNEDDKFIPDAETISKMKQLRAQKREEDKEDTKQNSKELDYIPLGECPKKVAQFGESRLVREEQDGEGDEIFEDYESSLTFGSAAVSKANAKLKMENVKNFMNTEQRFDGMEGVINEVVGGEEEDDEDVQMARKWEMEQIRKGVRDSTKTSSVLQNRQKLYVNQLPLITPLPTLSTTLARLSTYLKTLQSRHQELTTNLQTNEKELSTLIKTLETISKSNLESGKQRYEFFATLKSYFENVAGLFDAKIPELHKLENRFVESWKQHGIEQRNVLIQMLIDVFHGIVEGYPYLTPDLTDPASNEDKEDEVDEFGRDKTLYLRDMITKRRINRLQNYPPNTPIQTYIQSLPNLASISESLSTTKQDILTDSTTLLSDALPQFATQHSVLSQLHSWKYSYRKEFDMAFGNESYWCLLELFVRLECLCWDWLSNSKSIESFRWHQEFVQLLIQADENSHQNDTENMESILMTTTSKIINKFVLKYSVVPVIHNWEIMTDTQLQSHLKGLSKLVSDIKFFQGVDMAVLTTPLLTRLHTQLSYLTTLIRPITSAQTILSTDSVTVENIFGLVYYFTKNLFDACLFCITQSAHRPEFRLPIAVTTVDEDGVETIHERTIDMMMTEFVGSVAVKCLLRSWVMGGVYGRFAMVYHGFVEGCLGIDAGWVRILKRGFVDALKNWVESKEISVNDNEARQIVEWCVKLEEWNMASVVGKRFGIK